jgi:hypothetical protein
MKVSGTEPAQHPRVRSQARLAAPRPDRPRRSAVSPGSPGADSAIHEGIRWPRSRDPSRWWRESVLSGAARRRAVEGGPWRGTRNPWKDRVPGRWQQRSCTTDSSVEQGLEVGHSETGRAGAAHQQWMSRRFGKSSPGSRSASAGSGRRSGTTLRGGSGKSRAREYPPDTRPSGQDRMATRSPGRVGVPPSGGQGARSSRRRLPRQAGARRRRGASQRGTDRAAQVVRFEEAEMPKREMVCSWVRQALRCHRGPVARKRRSEVGGNGRRATGRGDAVRLLMRGILRRV